MGIKEEWRNVYGYEGLYEVSNYGRVRRKDNSAVLDGNVNSYGYKTVGLSNYYGRKNVKVHRLVALAFIPNPECKRNVNHIDGNKLNNYVNNLEWATHGENISHAMNILGVDYSSKPVVQLSKSGNFVAIHKDISHAARMMGGHSQHIGACCSGSVPSAYNFCWKFVDSEKLSNFLTKI